MYKILLILIVAALSVGSVGCGKLHPYYVDVQQGNVIDKDDIAKLKTGFSKNEVSSIIGSPLINDMFNADTWTYVYTNQINNGKIEKKKLVLEFKKNKLTQIAQ